MTYAVDPRDPLRWDRRMPQALRDIRAALRRLSQRLGDDIDFELASLADDDRPEAVDRRSALLRLRAELNDFGHSRGPAWPKMLLRVDAGLQALAAEARESGAFEI